MPIYEYQCQTCGHELEKLQKMSDAPLTDCPSCGEPQLKKKISAAAFRLKGGGWYETDFKSGDKKKNIAGDSSSGNKPASTDSTSSSKNNSSASGKTAGATPAGAGSGKSASA